MRNAMLLTMKQVAALSVAAFLLFSPRFSQSQTAAPTPTPRSTEAAPVHHATGSFDVKLAPQKPDNPQAEAASLGRMSLDKQFHGDLEAEGKGEMLSLLDREKGSGGYVALERVTGTLQGKKGSFVLQHDATMNRGIAAMTIVVVPDSGTGELTGIDGTMKVRIEAGGEHFYDFDYTLTAQ
jgi:hypothetical protein